MTARPTSCGCRCRRRRQRPAAAAGQGSAEALLLAAVLAVALFAGRTGAGDALAQALRGWWQSIVLALSLP